MTSNQFSIRLHEARQMMGLSMEKLAELTGGIITKQSISRYEKGLMLPKRVAKLAMAKALNISDSYFDGTNLKIDMPMLRTTSNGKLSEDELQALEAKLSFWAEQYLTKEKEAGFFFFGDHGTAQQRHAENTNQQQPRHDRLRCAFFAYPRKKIRRMEEQCAHHPHREQDAVHPRPPLHNGKDCLLIEAVIGRILAGLGSADEAAVQVAGPCGKVLLGADRAQCLIGRTAAQPCRMAEAVPCFGKGRGDIFRLDGLTGRGALASAAGQGARVTGGVDFVCLGLPIVCRCLGIDIIKNKKHGTADGPV